MKFRKIRKNVKAISPVLSVLMMIAVAVAASLVTYAWVMGYLNFTTDKVGKAIQIQSVANATGNLVVYVQNVGDGAVNFVASSSLYVDGVLQSPAISPTSLQAGATGNWTVNNVLLNKNLPLTLTIKVVTEDGTFTEATKTFG